MPVAIPPGSISTTVSPTGANSIRIASFNEAKPALATAAGAKKGAVVRAEMALMPTMWPRPRRKSVLLLDHRKTPYDIDVQPTPELGRRDHLEWTLDDDPGGVHNAVKAAGTPRRARSLGRAIDDLVVDDIQMNWRHRAVGAQQESLTAFAVCNPAKT